MFAVPGWSVAPALLRKQTDQPAASNTLPQPSEGGGTSRKRKRGTKKPAQEQIRDEDLAGLWNHHVEGKPPTSSDNKPAGVTEALPNALATSEKHKVAAKGRLASQNLPRSRAQAKMNATPPPEDGDVTHQSSKTKRRRKQREEAGKRKEEDIPAEPPLPQTTVDQALAAPKDVEVVLPSAALKLTPLQTAMRAKLTSARFRHLNQTLYTAPSTESMNLFKANPTFFEEYHSGFRQQVSAWPENPVDGFAQELKERGKVRVMRQIDRFRASQGQAGKEEKHEGVALPRNSGTCVVADLGCGDAALGKNIARVGAKLKIKVLSYDLHSQNPHVISSDISKLPLRDGEVSVAVFCLALMGTNWIDFIEEAWRVLQWKGELWIAEIKSRFTRGKQDRVVEHSVGKKRNPQKSASKLDSKQEQSLQEQLSVEVDGVEGKSQTDVGPFVEVLRRRGFALQSEAAIDMSNKMFVKLKFTKSLPPIKGKNQARSTQDTTATGDTKTKFVEERQINVFDEKTVLKPCLYKLR